MVSMPMLSRHQANVGFVACVVVLGHALSWQAFGPASVSFQPAQQLLASFPVRALLVLVPLVLMALLLPSITVNVSTIETLFKQSTYFLTTPAPPEAPPPLNELDLDSARDLGDPSGTGGTIPGPSERARSQDLSPDGHDLKSVDHVDHVDRGSAAAVHSGEEELLEYEVAEEIWDNDSQVRLQLVIDGWLLLGFLTTQVLCLLTATKRGFVAPWPCPLAASSLTTSIVITRLVAPCTYLRHRSALLMLGRGACSVMALILAAGMVQLATVKPQASGIAMLIIATLYKSALLQDQPGCMNLVFHSIEVATIMAAALRFWTRPEYIPAVLFMPGCLLLVLLTAGLLPIVVGRWIRMPMPDPPSYSAEYAGY